MMVNRQYISGRSFILKEDSTPHIFLDNSLGQFSNFSTQSAKSRDPS